MNAKKFAEQQIKANEQQSGRKFSKKEYDKHMKASIQFYKKHMKGE